MESVGPITDRLDQAGIKYELGRGGSEVMVAASDLARARVALARGGLPQSGRPGLELFDQPSWSMTDFTQRINYRRALEGELERTIGKMRGIDAAQVHLALHETSSFRASTTPAEASVVLTVRGETPSRDVVEGIAHLVASSVDGLESDNVTVVDDSGRLLSVPNEPGSASGLTSRQLAIQREVEDGLERKAEGLLAPIVGSGNARVQVAALVNFDRLERTTQTMDPDKQAASTEQKAEIVPGAQGGAGSSNTATTYENSKSTETFASAIGGVRRLTVAVLVNDKQTGTAEKPKFERRTALELARIDTLVKNAVGYDASRGDVVSVVSTQFTIPAPIADKPEPPPTLISRVETYKQPVLNVMALVLAFVVGFLALRSLRAPAGVGLPESALATGGTLPAAGAAPSTDALPRPVSADRQLSPNHAMRDRVAASVDGQPDVAARLVRAWMKE
jgi:flagellar M-ring protein FliF